jgi:hypothetical protein
LEKKLSKNEIFRDVGTKPIENKPEKSQKKGEFKIIFLSILLYNIMEVVL